MNYQSRFDDRWLGLLIKGIPLILAVGAGIVYAVELKDRVDVHEMRIANLERISDDLTEIKALIRQQNKRHRED